MSELKPVYDRNGTVVEAGDVIWNYTNGSRYKVYEIKESVLETQDIVVICRNLKDVNVIGIYRETVSGMEIVVPEEPKEFIEMGPV